MSEFKIATLNIHHRRPDTAIRRDVNALFERDVDVSCLQEMNGHLGAVEDITGIGLYMPQQQIGMAATPLLWRRDTMRPNGLRPPRLIHGPASKPGEAAGPEETASKFLIAGRFFHKPSSETFHIGNSHAAASNYMPAVRPLLEKHLAVIDDYATRRSGKLVFLAGDYNATIKDERFIKPVRAAHLVSNWQSASAPEGGTKGKRPIDHILFHRDERLHIAKQETVKLGSDHLALIVTYRLA